MEKNSLPLSPNHPDILKDFHQELEKAEVYFYRSAKDDKDYISTFIQGANWAYSYLLPLIQHLQEENEDLTLKLEQKTASSSMWASKVNEYSALRIELQNQIAQLQQENEKLIKNTIKI